jgi:hypothetical protein
MRFERSLNAPTGLYRPCFHSLCSVFSFHCSPWHLARLHILQDITELFEAPENMYILSSNIRLACPKVLQHARVYEFTIRCDVGGKMKCDNSTVPQTGIYIATIEGLFPVWIHSMRGHERCEGSCSSSSITRPGQEHMRSNIAVASVGQEIHRTLFTCLVYILSTPSTASPQI